MSSRSSIVRAARTSSQVITCSVSDHLLKGLPVSVVFFYRETLSAQQLTAALEKVLSDFPLFAGRLKLSAGELLIDCNNEGVQFSTYAEETSLNSVLETLSNERLGMLVDAIDSKKVIAQQSPILTVRLTHFSDRSTALGLCWHHSIGDMNTFMCLMRAWSAAANGLDWTPPLMVEDRKAYFQKHIPNSNVPTSLRYLNSIALLKLLLYLLTGARRKTSVKIYFSDSELARMRARFSEQAQMKLSRNDVLCAHMFSTLVALEDRDEVRRLAIAVNYRNKINLPQTLLGNPVDTVNLLIPPNSEPVAIAQTIRRSVDSFERDHLCYHANCRYVAENGGLQKIDRLLSKGIDPLKSALLVTNWSNFGVYDITFSGAKPLFFTSVGNVPLPWLSTIVEGFHNHGLIYSVLLPNSLARKLTQPASLKRLHQYRDTSEQQPDEIKALAWLR